MKKGRKTGYRKPLLDGVSYCEETQLYHRFCSNCNVIMYYKNKSAATESEKGDHKCNGCMRKLMSEKLTGRIIHWSDKISSGMKLAKINRSGHRGPRAITVQEVATGRVWTTRQELLDEKNLTVWKFDRLVQNGEYTVLGRTNRKNI